MASAASIDVSVNICGRFTKVGAAQKADIEQFPIIVDQVTGLMWDRREFDSMTEEQEIAHIKRLNAERFGGFDDWRRPTRADLLSICDITTHEPACDKQAFPECKSEFYRSSDKYVPDPAIRWGVYFYSGNTRISYASYRARVRACRPSQS